LFGVLIEEGLAVGDLPADVTSKWQVINLAAGSDRKQFPFTLPITGELATPTFSREYLARQNERDGLAANWFAWPPRRAQALRCAMLSVMEDTSRPAHWVPATHPSVWAPFLWARAPACRSGHGIAVCDL
jgi:hypothetical protein